MLPPVIKKVEKNDLVLQVGTGSFQRTSNFGQLVRPTKRCLLQRQAKGTVDKLVSNIFSASVHQAKEVLRIHYINYFFSTYAS